MSTSSIQQGFQHAWEDLKVRIDRGDENLTALIARHEGSDTDEARRLIDKRSGLDSTRNVWATLNDHAIATGDYAAAWRLFTDAVFTHWKNMTDPATRSGLALALDYQRGYGSDIDAPPVIAAVHFAQPRR